MTADYEKISKFMKTWSKKAQNKGVCVVTTTQPPRNNEYFAPPPRATDIGTSEMIFVDYIGCM
jgi:hypothetical protein